MLLHTVLAAALLHSLGNAEGPRVDTQHGTVTGSVLTVPGTSHRCHAFHNIPYAQPPIGPLRFARPQPLTPSPDAAIEGGDGEVVSCVSMPTGLPAREGRQQSEDCLLLHITAPRLPADDAYGYPVMLWLHGGAFQAADDLATAEGACANLVSSKRTLFVRVNYRLGYLGFLATGDATAPGNAGLYDQLQALRWAHENIKAFGGDPTRVTLAGHNAGAVSAAFLARYPDANGLLQRVIQMSGAPNAYWATSKQSVRSEAMFSEVVGCRQSESSARIACLRDKPLHELQQANERAFGPAFFFRQAPELPYGVGGGHDVFRALSHPWQPIPDGDIVRKSYKRRMLKAASPKPTIIGVTDNEAAAWIKLPELMPHYFDVVKDNQQKWIPFWVNAKNELSEKTLKKAIADAADVYVDADSFMRGRPVKHEMKQLLVEIVEAMYFHEDHARGRQRRVRTLIELVGDVLFGYPAVFEAQLLRDRQWEVWMYNYNFTASQSGWPHNTVSHAADVRTLFAWDPSKEAADTLRMRDLLVQLFVNHMRDGQPTSAKAKSAFTWSQYETLTHPTHLHLSLTPTMHDKLHEATLHSWTLIAEQVLEAKTGKARSKAIDGVEAKSYKFEL